MAEVRRQYQRAISVPSFVQGGCSACQSISRLDPSINFQNNDLLTCLACGARTPRLASIRQALTDLDAVTWSLLGSDFYIFDSFPMRREDYVFYDLAPLRNVKWHHEEAFPNPYSGGRYIAGINFFGDFALLSVQDTRESQPEDEDSARQAPPSPEDLVQVFWWRFGLQQRDAVPAWRQSLLGATTLILTQPSAAIVLIAAGFESFFVETMRIGWVENRLDPAGFGRLNRKNIPISSLIEWLPAVVDKPGLADDHALFQRWQTIVNQRRNDVVHRAVVHFTPEEARESMAAVLECIEFLDSFGLVRPHVYYRRAGVVNLVDDAEE